MALSTGNKKSIRSSGVITHQNIKDEAISIGTTETLMWEGDVLGVSVISLSAKLIHASQKLTVRAYSGYSVTDDRQAKFFEFTVTKTNQVVHIDLHPGARTYVRITVQGSAAATTGEVSIDLLWGSASGTTQGAKGFVEYTITWLGDDTTGDDKVPNVDVAVWVRGANGINAQLKTPGVAAGAATFDLDVLASSDDGTTYDSVTNPFVTTHSAVAESKNESTLINFGGVSHLKFRLDVNTAAPTATEDTTVIVGVQF